MSEPTGEVPLERRCVLPHAEPAARWLGFLCRRHYHEIDRRLIEVEMLFALRDEVILPGPSGDSRHATRFGSPAPGRIELMQITDARMVASMGDEVDVPGRLAAWVAMMFEERGWDPPEDIPLRVPRMSGPSCTLCDHATCIVIRNTWRRVGTTCGDWAFRDGAWRLPGDVVSLVRLLRRERKWIATQPWVDDYATELRDVHRAIATASGSSMWAQPCGRCPNCGTPLYYDMTGADLVRCRKCRASWSGVTWLRLRLIFEGDARRG